MKNFRKNLRFGLGVGGGGGGVEAAGVEALIGTFGGAIAAPTGVSVFADGGVYRVGGTGPGGSGSEVLSLRDPGRTMGLESAILAFGVSAYPLYIYIF